MTEINRMLTAKIHRQFFLFSPLQRVFAAWFKIFNLLFAASKCHTSQYNDSGSSRCSKWPNNGIVAVAKHCWLLIQGRRGCRER